MEKRFLSLFQCFTSTNSTAPGGQQGGEARGGNSVWAWGEQKEIPRGGNRVACKAKAAAWNAQHQFLWPHHCTRAPTQQPLRLSIPACSNPTTHTHRAGTCAAGWPGARWLRSGWWRFRGGSAPGGCRWAAQLGAPASRAPDWVQWGTEAESRVRGDGGRVMCRRLAGRQQRWARRALN